MFMQNRTGFSYANNDGEGGTDWYTNYQNAKRFKQTEQSKWDNQGDAFKAAYEIKFGNPSKKKSGLINQSMSENAMDNVSLNTLMNIDSGNGNLFSQLKKKLRGGGLDKSTGVRYENEYESVMDEIARGTDLYPTLKNLGLAVNNLPVGAPEKMAMRDRGMSEEDANKTKRWMYGFPMDGLGVLGQQAFENDKSGRAKLIQTLRASGLL